VLRIDKDDAPSLVLIRFPNLNGALVLVTGTELGHRTAYRWNCAGCFDEPFVELTLHQAREKANAHSATCRALPQPDRTAR
jgi:hypothetical protein